VWRARSTSKLDSSSVPLCQAQWGTNRRSGNWRLRMRQSVCSAARSTQPRRISGHKQRADHKNRRPQFVPFLTAGVPRSTGNSWPTTVLEERGRGGRSNTICAEQAIDDQDLLQIATSASRPNLNFTISVQIPTSGRSPASDPTLHAEEPCALIFPRQGGSHTRNSNMGQ
jgi:hypothetical protein